jgi:predicted ArsR family transcriptional regulator
MTLTYPLSPGWKARDTSAAAADSMVKRSVLLREQIYHLLRTRSMTADECAETLGESVLSVRPRCSELAKSNRIFDTGLRRKNQSGRSAVVWRTVHQQLEML